MDKILVSINCITYNHEKYIEQALQSFLSQKTNFKFEILVHDDASVDNTRKIIEKYKDKYPEIIKPIYQIENQYQKGKRVLHLNQSRAKGKYIAICEGDDYWTDVNKLQKQVDFMEKHSDCSLTVHGSFFVNAATDKIQSEYYPSKQSRYFSVEEIIRGDGGLFMTNSMVFKSEYKDDKPDFLISAPIGDYPLTINLALKGKVYYMHEIMSAYRLNAPGSWSERINSNESRIIEHLEKVIVMLDKLNLYTESIYAGVIRETQIDLLQRKYQLKYDIKGLKKINRYKTLNLKSKFVMILGNYFPNLFSKIRRLKRK